MSIFISNIDQFSSSMRLLSAHFTRRLQNLNIFCEQLSIRAHPLSEYGETGSGTIPRAHREFRIPNPQGLWDSVPADPVCPALHHRTPQEANWRWLPPRLPPNPDRDGALTRATGPLSAIKQSSPRSQYCPGGSPPDAVSSQSSGSLPTLVSGDTSEHGVETRPG